MKRTAWAFGYLPFAIAFKERLHDDRPAQKRAGVALRQIGRMGGNLGFRQAFLSENAEEAELKRVRAKQADNRHAAQMFADELSVAPSR